MSDAQFKLLVRPRPLVGEHRMGFRLRVATLNGLGDAGCLPKTVTAARSTQIGDRTWRHARHCPECLREQAVWWDDWTLAFLPVCLKHGVWLLDTCHACGTHLGWNKTRLVACRCGADLRQGHATRVPEGEMAVPRTMTGCHQGMGVAASEPPNRSPLSCEQIAALVLALGASVAKPNAKRPKRALNRSDLAQCREVFLAGTKILLDWPRNFEERLRRLMKRVKNNRLPPLARAFAAVYRPIFCELPGQEFEFLRTAFVEFVGTYWPEPLTSRNRTLRRSRADASDLMPLTRAAQEAGMRCTSLLKKCRMAGIKLRTRQPRQGKRTQRYVSRTAVRALSGDAQRNFGLRAAGRLIGLSAPRVRELIACGLLNAHQGKARSSRSIPLQAIAELQDRLAKVARKSPTNASDYVPLGRALRYRIPPGQFAPLLATVLDGSVAAYFKDGAAQRFDRLMVKLVDDSLASSEQCDHAALSVPEAAKCLGVKQEVAYSLVRNGHLRAHRRRNGMRHSMTIQRDAVNDFLNRYVSAGEIARKRKTSARAVITLLATAGIDPVTGPNVDGCRQAFYLRHATAVITSPGTSPGASSRTRH